MAHRKKSDKKNSKRRTKETGRARGKPSEFSEAISARAARRKHKVRKDSTPEMLRIFKGGWKFDEKTALANNSADKGYYLEKTVIANISPDDAHELFCHHNYSDQRKFNESHARRLGMTICVAPDIDFAIGPDGKAFIVNGQHTMWAIYLRGTTTQAAIKIWMCRDKQAMADLYAIFDDNKKRTLNNAIHAAQGASSLTYEGKETRLAKWSQCVGIAENEFSRKNSSKEGKSFQLDRAKREDVQSFAKWMDKHVQDSFQMKLVPQGIGAAFFAMWKSDRANAEKFAKQYFTGANLEKDSPALYMRNKIANRPKGLHAASVCREHAEIMFTAWRKACLNEPLQSLRRTIALPEPNKWKIYRSSSQLA
jgi:hypothetical protein